VDPKSSHTDPRRALVHLGSRQWVLEPGQKVTFGRGSPCDIRIAHDPLDEHVSRRAGVLEYVGEDLVVRNESKTRALTFKPGRGPERTIKPGGVLSCVQDREFLLALSGRDGHYVIQVTATTAVQTSGQPGSDQI